MQSANNNANTGTEEENATNCAIKMDFILTILMKTAKIFLLFYKVPKREKNGATVIWRNTWYARSAIKCSKYNL